jgi:hypothetical protein
MPVLREFIPSLVVCLEIMPYIAVMAAEAPSNMLATANKLLMRQRNIHTK